ncbi:MAG: MarC family protein [Candidatus Riflebacteria bacterium]|nr:MarC family protein [Candidatus Riflebacteria bacterium]
MSFNLLTLAMSHFVTVLAIVDPFATAPIFLAITPNNTNDERKKMALQAAIIACGVLLVFVFTGNWVFNFFGISVSAFRVAGGILLLSTALDTLRTNEGGKPQTPEEKRESVEKADVTITPLAIPLLAGPGAISTVALLGSNSKNIGELVIVGLAVIVACAVSWLILKNSSRLIKFIGQIGLKIVTRIMGLLLAGIGVQFILSGIREFWQNGGL